MTCDMYKFGVNINLTAMTKLNLLKNYRTKLNKK